MGEPKFEQEIKQRVQYSGEKIKTTLADVENSFLFYPALQGLALDIAGLNFYIKNPTNDWQSKLWQGFIDTVLPEILPEICEKAWVYGHCLSVIKEYGTFIYNGKRRIFPKWVTPIDIGSEPEIKDGFIRVSYDEYYPLSNVMENIFTVRSGRVYANGERLRTPIMYLDTIYKAWATSTASNSLGYLVVTKNESVKLSEDAEMNLAKFINGHGKDMGIAVELPEGYNAQILASPTRGVDFKEAVNQFSFALFSSIRQNWLMNTTTTPGTYGSMRAIRQASLDYILNLGRKLTYGLNNLIYNVARLNNEMPTVEIDVSSDYSLDTSPDDLLKMTQGIKGFIDMLPYLTPSLKKHFYEMFGLPMEDETFEVVDDEPTANSEAVEKWLSFKKTAWFGLVERRRNEEIKYIRLTGIKKLVNLLALDDSQEKELIADWDILEKELNRLATSDDYENEYEIAWNTFYSEVTKWIET